MKNLYLKKITHFQSFSAFGLQCVILDVFGRMYLCMDRVDQIPIRMIIIGQLHGQELFQIMTFGVVRL